jgi:pyrroloquinoline quinone (PQQ) biosynthesis protein C
MRMHQAKKPRPPGGPPPLSEEQILAWADAFYKRVGRWPRKGRDRIIPGSLGEKWITVDTALRVGLRGLPGGSSLARLLAQHRGVPNIKTLPPLTIREILAWAGAHRRRTGQWPKKSSGLVLPGGKERWSAIDTALNLGARGLPGGSSLARLLEEERGVRNKAHSPPLSLPEILAWADEHHARTGKWPHRESGPVAAAPGETWFGVHGALFIGCRGFPGGSSLAQVLAEHRGVRNIQDLPPLTEKQILAWIDKHQRHTGQWPLLTSGPIAQAPGENWSAVQSALVLGNRGLPGGSSLARLLAEHRGVRNPAALPPLTEEQILAWADEHYARTGQWPQTTTGPVVAAPGETWAGLHAALTQGCRGLSPGSSLARLLAEHRGVRNIMNLPRLTIKQILAWADEHYARTGQWPRVKSGPVIAAPGETWMAVQAALQQGSRGQHGGSSLAQVLAEHRGVRNIGALKPLTVEQILAWADQYHDRTGRWPNDRSGEVAEAPGEAWSAIDAALHNGRRGFPGGSSLAQLLAEHRGVRNIHRLPPLTLKQIRVWANTHCQRTGCWPTAKAGAIADAPGETWLAVDMALRHGRRGLPGGLSLARLLGTPRSRPG